MYFNILFSALSRLMFLSNFVQFDVDLYLLADLHHSMTFDIKKNWPALWLFIVMGMILLLWLYLSWQWLLIGRNIISFPSFNLPSWREIIDNIRLCFSGYQGGYRRSLLGYLAFAPMAATILASGRGLGRASLGAFMESLSLAERVSLYYMLGSLGAGLYWLTLGSLGWLSPALAYLTAGLGSLIFVWQTYIYLRQEQGRFRQWIQNRARWENLALALLVLLVLLWSANAVTIPAYTDAHDIHLALPAFYIGQGKVMAYPYQIYTYYPQNLEMLITWALLLRSEVTASLLMWSFFVAFALFILGFFYRNFNAKTAWGALLIFLSAPVCALFALTIKNDFIIGLLLFTHYCLLAESLQKIEKDPRSASSGIFLTGILCGGAVGYKLNALLPLLFSTLLICIFNRKFLNPWTRGVLISLGPWLLRSAWLTHNPIYPYFSHLLHLPLIAPWHIPTPQANSLAGNGLSELYKYFAQLLGFYVQSGAPTLPNWGPTLLCALLSIPTLCSASFTRAQRWTLGAACLSWAGLSLYSLAPRYQIGILLYLVLTPFALFYAAFPSLRFARVQKWIVPTALCASFYFTFFQLDFFQMITDSFLRLSSGYAVGNYKTKHRDIDHEIWLAELINARSAPTERVLYSGVIHNFGLKRRFYPQNDLDKERLVALAQSAPTAEALRDQLKALGVGHILVRPQFLKNLASHPRPEMRLYPSDYQKIKNLFEQKMHLRFVCSDHEYYWYSFPEFGKDFIKLQSAEVREFPIQGIEHAETLYLTQRLSEAKELCQTALRAPMLPEIKAAAYSLYGLILMEEGQFQESENAFLSGIALAPNRTEPYLELAQFYWKRKELAKCLAALEDVINHNRPQTVETLILEKYPELLTALRRLEGV